MFAMRTPGIRCVGLVALCCCLPALAEDANNFCSAQQQWLHRELVGGPYFDDWCVSRESLRAAGKTGDGGALVLFRIGKSGSLKLNTQAACDGSGYAVEDITGNTGHRLSPDEALAEIPEGVFEALDKRLCR